MILSVTTDILCGVSQALQSPLTGLTEKVVDFEWDNDCKVSFQTLKHKLVNAPILSLSERGKCFTVYTDASRIGLGCVLK
jgi:hypothetical protein